MASSSSSPGNWRYNVFTSFHGPDVRQTLLTHLRKQFSSNGITMFDDQGMERGHTIDSSLKEAIGESRIAIVLLTNNYASSSWCLDELLEILDCQKKIGQIVMTVFYGVDPSDVRKQNGEFGRVFDETCARKSEEQKEKWSKALNYVGNIAGEHFQNWDDEAKKIEKIARDVSLKLNFTPCKDFDGKIGLDNHVREMESLLDLDNLGVKIVGISGPAGIGKSTIARALYSRHSGKFHNRCYVDKLWENYKIGHDEYPFKLRLHEEFFSKVLKQNGMEISHLGLIKERLQYQKVLIILDDVESVAQVDALAHDISWFGPGSRVIVVTENKNILKQHGINVIYKVGFPSEREALMIFCLYAFKRTSPPDGFMDLASEVVEICDNLPLALCVLGSSLRASSHGEWNDELRRFKSSLDGRIESVLKVGYESLHEEDGLLFRFIAVFFNYKRVDDVTSTFRNTDVLDVRLGLKNLVDRCLIHIDCGTVVMHNLLQVMGKKVNSNEELSKRKILEDPDDVCDVLKEANGTGSVLGVSLNIAKVNRLNISEKAFIRMYKLHILKVKGWKYGGDRQLYVPENMEFPCSLRLLDWESYPRKSFQFYPKNLVILNMNNSKLERLWEETQELPNLKEMDLSWSSCLMELPDLSKAKNLKTLYVNGCKALVEIPSSVVNLPKLYDLLMYKCKSLQVIPTLINLESIKYFYIDNCPRLRIFPEMPTNIMNLSIKTTGVEELPVSFRHCSHLTKVEISENENLKNFSTHLPTSVTELNFRDSQIERIADCIKGLHNLKILNISDCKRLESLPELPHSLRELFASNCESLKRVSVPLTIPEADLYFGSCFRLGRQAKRAIIQRLCFKGFTLLPEIEVPEEFDYRGRGTKVTIPRSDFNRYKDSIGNRARGDSSTVGPSDFNIVQVCLVVPTLWLDQDWSCKFSGNSVKYMFFITTFLPKVTFINRKHILIFVISLPLMDPSEVSKEIVLEFKCRSNYCKDDNKLFECGVKILTDEPEGIRCWGSGEEDWQTRLYDEESDKEDNRNLNCLTLEDHEYESVSVNQEDFLGTVTKTSAFTAYEEVLYMTLFLKSACLPFPDQHNHCDRPEGSRKRKYTVRATKHM
ncbi:disease resistance protein ADR2-like [Capsella rubella]|uniref:disease resistance protein ADR2-like n=1 Tax=Capsella rubella TaxID=81985 RepID=UPI000CD51523|nr:disease resistance protein ADR2-like [Capsella rubella]